MKLRLRSNSLRLRLNRGDVEKLLETGLVEETVEFKPHPLVFLLHASSETKGLQATFHGGWLTVSVPHDSAVAWAGGDQVGMEGEYDGVGILVEKDWACAHGSAEENADTFPAPPN